MNLLFKSNVVEMSLCELCRKQKLANIGLRRTRRTAPLTQSVRSTVCGGRTRGWNRRASGP
jgi:hypothetical protein